MVYKLFDVAIMIAIAIIGVLVVQESAQLPKGFGGDVGSGTFPAILGWLLIGICGVGAVVALMSQAQKLSFPNLGRLAATVGFLSVFTLTWSWFGYFYLQLAVFLFALLAFYRAPRGLTGRVHLQNGLLAAGIALTFYIVFNHVMYVKL